jgi:hypothetical protein
MAEGVKGVMSLCCWFPEKLMARFKKQSVFPGVYLVEINPMAVLDGRIEMRAVQIIAVDKLLQVDQNRVAGKG